MRYSQIAALERVADDAWPAPERDRLGGWLLRAAGGFTNRANSALPLGDPGMDLDPAIDACAEWYRARSLLPKITVPLPLRRDVADALGRRGWQAQPLVLVQTAALTDLLAESPADPLADPLAAATVDPVEVRLTPIPSPGFLAVITARKEGLPEAAHHTLRGGDETRFAEVPATPTGEPNPTGESPATPWAIARGAVVGEWMHLGLVEVAEPARRRGLARTLTRALAAWASAAGAQRAFLQVEEHNTAAVALYGSMAFRTHHTYRTYHLPPDH